MVSVQSLGSLAWGCPTKDQVEQPGPSAAPPGTFRALEPKPPATSCISFSHLFLHAPSPIAGAHTLLLHHSTQDHTSSLPDKELGAGVQPHHHAPWGAWAEPPAAAAKTHFGGSSSCYLPQHALQNDLQTLAQTTSAFPLSRKYACFLRSSAAETIFSQFSSRGTLTLILVLLTLIKTHLTTKKPR